MPWSEPLTAMPRSFNAAATEAMAVPQIPTKWMERAFSMVGLNLLPAEMHIAYLSDLTKPSFKAKCSLGQMLVVIEFGPSQAVEVFDFCRDDQARNPTGQETCNRSDGSDSQSVGVGVKFHII